MKFNIHNFNLYYSNTYKVSNNGQLIKLESNILGAQTLIVTDDDGSLESVDEQPTAAVIENGNVTGIVMSKTNDTNITQYELRPNNNASKQSNNLVFSLKIFNFFFFCSSIFCCTTN